jgi:acyl-CoA hydrolase
MEGKRVKDGSITIVYQMSHRDADLAANVHRGVIMKNIDIAEGIVASRHSTGNTVTASIERLDFPSPVFIGDLLRLKAGLNRVERTMIEMGCALRLNTSSPERCGTPPRPI